MAAAQSKSRNWPEHSSWGKSHWRSTSKVPMATEFARFRLRKPPAWGCAHTPLGAGTGASPAARRIPSRRTGSCRRGRRRPCSGAGPWWRKRKSCLGFFEKFGKAFIGGKREIGPVVQPGVAQLFVFQLKAHGPHQVQGRAGDGAGAGDVPRVLGDFRLY